MGKHPRINNADKKKKKTDLFFFLWKSILLRLQQIGTNVEVCGKIVLSSNGNQTMTELKSCKCLNFSCTNNVFCYSQRLMAKVVTCCYVVPPNEEIVSIKTANPSDLL